MDPEKYQQQNAPANLPSRRENSNVRQVLSDRMLLSEAIDAAGKLIDQFPNAKGYSNGFIGALAQVLMQYPRQVVMRCIDARSGLARDTKFLSISEAVGWLERDVRPVCEEADREARIKVQQEETAAWLRQTVPDSLKLKGMAWLDRSDPQAAELSGEKAKVLTPEQKEKLIEDARAAGKQITSMKLRPETLKVMGLQPEDDFGLP